MDAFGPHWCVFSANSISNILTVHKNLHLEISLGNQHDLGIFNGAELRCLFKALQLLVDQQVRFLSNTGHMRQQLLWEYRELAQDQEAMILVEKRIGKVNPGLRTTSE